jgi:hypothetical protein
MVTEFVGLLKRHPDGLKFYVDMFVMAEPMRRAPRG